MMVVYSGMLLPPIRISVVILLLHVVYMIVVYTFVGGGVMILTSDGIINILLWVVGGGCVSVNFPLLMAALDTSIYDLLGLPVHISLN